MNWADKRVLVTGGTGFLGYHLCKQLCALGARVRAFALPLPQHHPRLAMPVDLQTGDVRDVDAVRRAAEGCEVIFHTAGTVAMWGPALAAMHEIHEQGTRNVLAAAGRTARIIHTSSIVAIGATRNGNVLNEESSFTLCGERIDYVQAKRAAEVIALRAAGDGQDVVVVNPGYLLGPEDYEPSVMGKFCERTWKGRMIVAAPGGYNLVDVRDAASGHILAAACGLSGRRYILGGENLWMPEFVRRLAAIANLKPRAVPRLPNAAMWLAAAIAELRSWKTGRPPYPSFQHARLNQFAWFVSSQRAARELGFRARPIAETLRDTFSWFAGSDRVAIRGLSRWWMRAA